MSSSSSRAVMSFEWYESLLRNTGYPDRAMAHFPDPDARHIAAIRSLDAVKTGDVPEIYTAEASPCDPTVSSYAEIVAAVVYSAHRAAVATSPMAVAEISGAVLEWADGFVNEARDDIASTSIVFVPHKLRRCVSNALLGLGLSKLEHFGAFRCGDGKAAVGEFVPVAVFVEHGRVAFVLARQHTTSKACVEEYPVTFFQPPRHLDGVHLTTAATLAAARARDSLRPPHINSTLTLPSLDPVTLFTQRFSDACFSDAVMQRLTRKMLARGGCIFDLHPDAARLLPPQSGGRPPFECNDAANNLYELFPPGSKYESIGKGTYGEVYKVTEPSGETYAWKVIRVWKNPDNDASRISLQALNVECLFYAIFSTMVEAKLIPRVYSAHIIIPPACARPESVYVGLRMEYFPASVKTLIVKSDRHRYRELRTRFATNAVENLRRIIVFFALLHASAIAWNDMKPDNLVVDDAGLVRVIDAGMVTGMNDPQYPNVSNTPGYTCAPEWSPLHRQDAGALAITALEMFFESPIPFAGPNMPHLTHAFETCSSMVDFALAVKCFGHRGRRSPDSLYKYTQQSPRGPTSPSSPSVYISKCQPRFTVGEEMPTTAFKNVIQIVTFMLEAATEPAAASAVDVLSAFDDVFTTTTNTVPPDASSPSSSDLLYEQLRAITHKLSAPVSTVGYDRNADVIALHHQFNIDSVRNVVVVLTPPHLSPLSSSSLL